MRKFIIFFCFALALSALSSCSKTHHDIFAGLYGIVSDSETGDLIPTATVTLSPGGRSTVTGADGRWEFNDLDATQYTITVQKTGYSTNRKTITAVSGEQTEVNIPLTKNK
ncbi:MAG: carboxypeptidase-like regulatory domain-containing protein [Bacteroidales bacterium]|jgi:hypothetical protein|nr:carboxypeptidase-like regulatory domain-containing protein [Bacteroidales bacterium]